MLLVCDIGPDGRAKELSRVGNASGIGGAARSLSRYVKENRTLVVTSVCAIVLVMLLENVLDQENRSSMRRRGGCSANICANRGSRPSWKASRRWPRR